MQLPEKSVTWLPEIISGIGNSFSADSSITTSMARYEKYRCWASKNEGKLHVVFGVAQACGTECWQAMHARYSEKKVHENSCPLYLHLVLLQGRGQVQQ